MFDHIDTTATHPYYMTKYELPLKQLIKKRKFIYHAPYGAEYADDPAGLRLDGTIARIGRSLINMSLSTVNPGSTHP